MNKRLKQFVSVCSIFTALLLAAALPLSADSASGEVQVEEIDLNQPSNQEQAEDLWDQTKRKTTEAASAAAEYSKVQGTRILEGSKQGLAKGAETVAIGSQKAWDATKEAGSKAADYTVEKATEVGEAVSESFSSEDAEPGVTERSIETTQTD